MSFLSLTNISILLLLTYSTYFNINRAFKRTEGNLIKAREILRKSYLSRHAADHVGGEMANVYFDEAMKANPKLHGRHFSKRY